MSISIEHYDLSGRHALVVGTDGPAGSAIAGALTEAGASVLAVEAPADATAAVASVRTARQQVAGLEIIVCATDRFMAKPIELTTLDELDRVITHNFIVPFAVAREAAAAFAEVPASRLILVSHVLGERGVSGTSAYGAAHAATQSLVRSLAQELGPGGTVVNGIQLGWMDWMDDRLPQSDPEAGRAGRFTIMKRLGEAEEVGPLAVWLSGTGAGYVSGQVFTVDGGLLQHL